jgi:hypothetical protein
MNRKLTNAAIAALLLVPLAAISQDKAPAATPASDATAAGTGTVVFFRESKFVGGGMRYKVRENGIELCKLSNGSYCSVQVATGKHSYEVHSEAKDVLTLEVESGETYYVQGSLSVGVLAGHPNLAPSSKEAFEALKAKLKDNTGKDLDPPGDKDKK